MQRRGFLAFVPAVATAGAVWTTGCSSLRPGSGGNGDADADGGNEEDADEENTGEGETTEGSDEGDTAGGNTGEVDEATRAAIEDLLVRNARAYEEEDERLIEETLHPESPVYENTLATSRQLWREHDLAVEVRVVEITVAAEEATVRFEQETRAVGDNSDAFQDNRVTGTHVLRRYDGEWRIYSTATEDVEPIVATPRS